MNSKHFALVAGAVYALVGVLGFIPGLLSSPPPDAPPLRVDAAYGYLFGLFPVNVLHSLVHLGLGVWGIAAARALSHARMYARSLAVLYGVLTVMGLIPILNTTFGLIPLFGHDVWLHAITAAIAAYFGFGQGRVAEVEADRVRRAA